MFDAVTHVPAPRNEPPREYAPGEAGTASLRAQLAETGADHTELTMTIGGAARRGGGETVPVVAPHDHRRVLGTLREATPGEVEEAVDAALAAGPGWRELSFDDRAAIFLRAAELLTGPWRDRLNAATMLGQSKTVYQAEIDAVCELADFFRFNVHFARQLLAEQPLSAPGCWNRTDHRPLEGFVLAITPFNFTSIGVNLPTAPALLGNTVVWKPSPTAQLASHAAMELLAAAGLPAGVVNMVTGSGAAVSRAALPHRDLAGIHFTGSTATFQGLWRGVAENLPGYRSYPRLVGETGGKDFVLAHPSAEPQELITALIRGAFDYQGQKCSAASRAYLPRSLWARIRTDLVERVESLTVGDPEDFTRFCGAVIDQRAYDRLAGAIDHARDDSALDLVAGGGHSDEVGFFVHPTVVQSSDPGHDLFSRELFGPVLALYIYPDGDFADVCDLVANTSPYGLTGAVFATDRAAIALATERLRFAAGNFYVNDKPTGAVVGQQPFGGARGSGTDDKAGSALNLLRWSAPRALKETFVPPVDHRYPHQG